MSSMSSRTPRVRTSQPWRCAVVGFRDDHDCRVRRFLPGHPPWPLIAVALMIAGITSIGSVTATFASRIRPAPVSAAQMESRTSDRAVCLIPGAYRDARDARFQPAETAKAAAKLHRRPEPKALGAADWGNRARVCLICCVPTCLKTLPRRARAGYRLRKYESQRMMISRNLRLPLGFARRS